MLLKYHMMEERAQARTALLQWAVQAPLLRAVFDASGRRLGLAAESLGERMLGELVTGGALTVAGDEVRDA